MAIAYDAGSEEEGAPGTSPLTWSHTCTGTNRLLLVGITHFNGDVVTGVTYNGVAMTQLDKTSDFGGAIAYTYGLLNPATGSNNIAVSFSGGDAFLRCTAGSYTGVSQIGLPDAVAHAQNTTAAQTSIGTTVTTIADNTWVGSFSLATGGTFSSITNGTIRTTAASGLAVWGDTNSDVTPAGGKTLTANFASSSQQCILLVSFAPVTGSASASASASRSVSASASRSVSASASASASRSLSPSSSFSPSASASASASSSLSPSSSSSSSSSASVSPSVSASPSPASYVAKYSTFGSTNID